VIFGPFSKSFSMHLTFTLILPMMAAMMVNGHGDLQYHAYFVISIVFKVDVFHTFAFRYPPKVAGM